MVYLHSIIILAHIVILLEQLTEGHGKGYGGLSHMGRMWLAGESIKSTSEQRDLDLAHVSYYAIGINATL